MIAVWSLALTVFVSPAGEDLRTARVVADAIDVLDEPDDAAFSTGRLTRGRRVTIRRDGPQGWVTIDPPDGSFSFVEETELEDLGDGRARVLVQFASVRPGRDGARLPGPPRVTLRQGTIVRLLDRRPLVVRRRGAVETWIAIAPPRQEARFVRADALVEGLIDTDENTGLNRDRLAARKVNDGHAIRDSEAQTKRIGPITPAFLSVPRVDPTEGVSDDVARALSKIASSHRSEIRKSMDRWNLGPIEADYRRLLKGGIEAADKRAVERRLEILRRQKSASESALTIASLVNRSRARDGQVAEIRRGATGAGRAIEGDFDATGLLQTSSRLVEGRKVLTLLGDDGGVAAYLSIPPGLSTESLMSHRVGVRGEGRFEETLGTRLIQVQDMERLDRERKDLKSKEMDQSY